MDVLRGNFPVKRPVAVETATATLEDRFEREALKRLGGSIAFVSRKKLLWSPEAGERDQKTTDERAKS